MSTLNTVPEINAIQIPVEQCYTPKQISAAWGLSDAKVRRMFENEPGVLKIGEPSRRVGRALKRRYYTLRVPESVMLRVQSRLRYRAS